MPTGSGELLVEGGAVLLRDDLDTDARGHYCDQALSVGPAENRAELLVTFPGPGERVGTSGDTNGRQPKKRGVIAVGDTMAVRAIAGDDIEFDDRLVLAGIPDPTDLQAIGTTISKICQVLSKNYHLTLCFNSLTDLLATNDPETVFQFTHILTKLCEKVDMIAHFHVDPDAHEERIVRAFANLFDQEFSEFEADEEALDVTPKRSRASQGDIRETFEDETETTAAADTDGGQDSVTEATDEDIANAFGE